MVPRFPVPRFPPLSFGPAFSTPAFLMVPRFPVPRFQSPRDSLRLYRSTTVQITGSKNLPVCPSPSGNSLCALKTVVLVLTIIMLVNAQCPYLTLHFTQFEYLADVLYSDPNQTYQVKYILEMFHT